MYSYSGIGLIERTPNLYRHQNEVPFRFQEYSNKQEELSKPFKFPISSSEADPLQSVTCNITNRHLRA